MAWQDNGSDVDWGDLEDVSLLQSESEESNIERIVRVYDGPLPFQRNSPAKLVRMGTIAEVTAYLARPKAPPLRRISADFYEDLRTNEVFEYSHIENRSQCAQSIRRTLFRVRAIINTNVLASSCARWVTLTYRDNMCNTKQLYDDFSSFWKRFKRFSEKMEWGRPEYICIVEPQGRGAWHIHAFFLWNVQAPFIPNNEILEPLWGHGWTVCRAISGAIDDIGAYFSAYLSDIELKAFEKLPESEKVDALSSGSLDIVSREILDYDGKLVKKRVVKGARLHMYPPKMQILRRSKGIRNPVEERIIYGDACRDVGKAQRTYSRAYEIIERNKSTGAEERINIISKEYYNERRQ